MTERLAYIGQLPLGPARGVRGRGRLARREAVLAGRVPDGIAGPGQAIKSKYRAVSSRLRRSPRGPDLARAVARWPAVRRAGSKGGSAPALSFVRGALLSSSVIPGRCSHAGQVPGSPGGRFAAGVKRPSALKRLSDSGRTWSCCPRPGQPAAAGWALGALKGYVAARDAPGKNRTGAGLCSTWNIFQARTENRRAARCPPTRAAPLRRGRGQAAGGP